MRHTKSNVIQEIPGTGLTWQLVGEATLENGDVVDTYELRNNRSSCFAYFAIEATKDEWKVLIPFLIQQFEEN